MNAKEPVVIIHMPENLVRGNNYVWQPCVEDRWYNTRHAHHRVTFTVKAGAAVDHDGTALNGIYLNVFEDEMSKDSPLIAYRQFAYPAAYGVEQRLVREIVHAYLTGNPVIHK